MREFLLSLWLLPAALGLRAQNSFYVSPGAQIFIGAGTPLAIDGLVLTPSAGYTINGENRLDHALATIHPAGNVYIQRVYRWDRTLPPFTGSIAFYYRDAELNGIPENALTLNVHDGSNWNAFISNITRDVNNNFVTTPLPGASISELTLASLQGALPMQWLGVEAVKQNGAVHINWRTANEINCAGYQVEKSSNGLTWTNLGSAITAKNTPGPNAYTFTDGALPAVMSYYRIRQTDPDARYRYSIIVSVKGDRTGGAQVYPIPAGDVINIAAGTGVQLKSVKLYNAAGSLLVSENPAGTPVFTMDLHRFAAGSYTAFIVLSDNTTFTRSFIKK